MSLQTNKGIDTNRKLIEMVFLYEQFYPKFILLTPSRPHSAQQNLLMLSIIRDKDFLIHLRVDYFHLRLLQLLKCVLISLLHLVYLASANDESII